jgi:hypothetical protein
MPVIFSRISRTSRIVAKFNRPLSQYIPPVPKISSNPHAITGATAATITQRKETFFIIIFPPVHVAKCVRLVLFRVGRYGMNHVRIPLDRKIKAPRSGNSGLPEVARLVVFFGAQRRVAQVLEQKNKFTIKGSLNVAGSGGVHFVELVSRAGLHFFLSFFVCR